MKRQLLIGGSACALATVLASWAAAQPPQGAGGGPSQVGTAGQSSPPSDALFNLIDTDGDGVITRAELRKAMAALKKLDVDKDGRITRGEAMTTPGGSTLQNQGTVGMNGGQGGFGQGNGGFGAGMGDPRMGPDLARFDRNGDGSLSADEVPPQMRGLVNGSDQNGNGQLDPQELAIIKQRMNEQVRGQRALPPGVTVGPGGVQRKP